MIWALLACTTVQDTPDEPPETTDTEVPEDTVSTSVSVVSGGSSGVSWTVVHARRAQIIVVSVIY